MRKLDEAAQRYGLPIRSEALLKKLVDDLPETMSQLAADHTLFGLRTEAMFAYVAAALRGCKVIHQEDSGIGMTEDEELAPPDYRILTECNHEFFVEVKNHHKWRKPFRVRQDYLSRLENYARTFNKPLRLAVYWSQWNLWSLVDPVYFENAGRFRQIGMGPAMLRNEMVTIGDCWIGTVPPLTIRVHADAHSPSTLDRQGDEGLVQFRIGGITLHANGVEITENTEKAIAFYLMLFGNWTDQRDQVLMDGDRPSGAEIECRPQQESEHHTWQFVGELSSMISSCYRLHTSDNGQITRLTPGRDPSALMVSIPEEYNGKALRLWRFYMYPKGASESSMKEHWSRIKPRSY